MLPKHLGAWIALTLLLILPAQAHPHHRHPRASRAGRGGTTFCTFYHDRQGRTASNLVPRGSWVLLSRGGTAVRVHITDRGVSHFDLTPSQFRRFAPLHRGVVGGVRYHVLSRG